jgi:hypothetical protein
VTAVIIALVWISSGIVVAVLLARNAALRKHRERMWREIVRRRRLAVRQMAQIAAINARRQQEAQAVR